MSIRLQPVPHLAQCSVAPLLGGISIAGLATLRDPAHEAMARVTVPCAQGCGAEIEAPRFFATLTACDACVAKARKAELLDRAKTYWEALCPPSLRETDKTHAAFPAAIYDTLRDYNGGESLLLFGPSGRCKTRVGVLLIKRCLVRYSAHVGILWPEQLKAAKNAMNRLELIERWGRYDLLLMDDSFLTGAQDEKLGDFLKDLLDYRMRYKRHQIITSQIGGEEYKEQADKFDNVTAADLKRVEALLRRVRETCRVVSFASAKPTTTEEQAF
jgi:hypothetical protein